MSHLAVIMSSLLLAIGLWMVYASLPMAWFGADQVKLVAIQSGMSAKEVADTLYDAGVIREPMYFLGVARVLRSDTKMQAGIYAIEPHDSVYHILRDITEGHVATYRVTIPEGRTVRDIAHLLASHGLVDPNRFATLALEKVAHPVENSIGVEGYLFPDTYDIPLGMNEEQIISFFLDRFRQLVLPLIDQAQSPLNLHEIVTLASIVESEARLPEERPIIASVYLNRLDIGMPLQADPTVIYALPERPRRVLYSHLAVDSPYNTYLYAGLPPGPIANPGLDSIRAVLEPATTDYLYFVARPDGSHHFSVTFEEHLAAIEMYRR